ncbi:ABC transporter substrate-binding protein [Treponema primitia]|uniref:ABC transporter substrate-binding protein n=1 Tax=Treponema primitia TaxID=88058 RepID=UPI0002554F85|nr:ABC transporter substrate-binding protein [Treponema primitia]
MKNHVKAGTLVLIGLALSLPLYGGGSKDAGGNKFVIFQSKVEITTQLEAAAKAYQKETGVEVEVWSTTGDDYFHQLRTRIANNQGPTLFSLTPGAEITQVANYLEDLSALPFVKDIADSMLSKSSGKVIGIPYTVEGFGLVYNKSLTNPAAVRDYNSFVKLLQDSKAAGINGVGLSQESYFLIGHILNTPFAVMPNMEQYMDRLAKGEVKMADTKEFQEFARFYAAIRDNSYNPLEVNYDRECGDFATGKTAAIHQGNWCYPMFADYKVNFEIGLMPFPLGGNDKLAVSVPTVWSVNSQAPEAQRKLAKDFLTWLYTSENGKRFVTEEFGFIPVVKGMTSNNLDPLSAEVSRYATEGKTIPWATNLYPAGIVDVYLAPTAQQFFTSKMTPQEFLVALDNAWAKASGR